MGIQTFCSSVCWTAPTCLTQVCAQVWGGGAMGGCWTICCCAIEVTQGGGGGGGGYGKGIVPITGGHTYRINVGGSCGGSCFKGNSCRLVGAHAGSKGQVGVGGAGGSGYGNAATTTHQGGTGSVSNGGTGAAPCGGLGGTPCQNFGQGCAGRGHPPGGGGAGGFYFNGHNQTGPGVGAHGRITLTWTCPSPQVVNFINLPPSVFT
jgi:trimeric autotransporter adhesin